MDFMKGQRVLLLGYFGVALTIFYSAYYYLVSSEKPSLLSYSVSHYLIKSPLSFQRKCVIYYLQDGRITTKDAARNVARRLEEGGISAESRDIRYFKHVKSLLEKGTVSEPMEDMLDVSRDFSVVLRYVKTPENDGDFDVIVTGGKCLLFHINKRAMKNDYIQAKICDLIKNIFFKYKGMPSTRMTPLLDLNFLLMSDNRRVHWNAKDDLITTYFRPIINVMSLFYNVSIHNRIISGANLTKRMKLKNSEIGDYGVIDMQDQGAGAFDLLDRVTTVEVGAVDSTIYRNSLSFVCHVPHVNLRFYDNTMKRETKSVSLKGMGVISLLNIEEAEDDEEYTVTPQDIHRLVGTWVTHIRKFHNLPTTLTDTMLDGMGSDDEVTIVEDGHYVVNHPDAKFTIKLEKPGLVAFYGFEVSKMADSVYRLYLKGAVNNIEKVVGPIYNIGMMTNVSQETLQNTRIAHEAVSILYETTVCNDKPSNGKLLSLAKSAFIHSLEALGDHETYAKNVMSMEHGFALLMCDVFPFLFPLIANGVKCALNK